MAIKTSYAEVAARVSPEIGRGNLATSEQNAKVEGSYASALTCTGASSSPVVRREELVPFTVSSYNIGGLISRGGTHYDRAMAASMAEVMRVRRLVDVEVGDMSAIEGLQGLFLKTLFSSNQQEVADAVGQRDREYNSDLQWYFKNGRQVRNQKASNHLRSILGSYRGQGHAFTVFSEKVRRALAMPLSSQRESEDAACKNKIKEIFRDSLHQDIICIQEANWINHEMFASSKYDSIFTTSASSESRATQPSRKGIAWNRDRFAFVKPIESIEKRAIAVQLRDKINNKIVSVVSALVSGCDPFSPREVVRKVLREVENLSLSDQIGADPAAATSSSGKNRVGDSSGVPHGAEVEEGMFEPKASGAPANMVEERKYDSTRGDEELRDIFLKLEEEESDLVVIGTDLNVTSLHPRMRMFRNFGYQLDYINEIYPTCTAQSYCLDARLDWIFVKPRNDLRVSIRNLPIDTVGLNDLRTNVSDHKPVASEVSY